MWVCTMTANDEINISIINFDIQLQIVTPDWHIEEMKNLRHFREERTCTPMNVSIIDVLTSRILY